MYVRVHCVPGAKRENLRKESDTIYHIQVREEAQRNMANKRVKELLAAELGLNKGELRLISGHRSPTKVFSITNNK